MKPRTHPTDRLEQAPLLLPHDVPVRVASWTAWLLLAVFAAAAVFACTVSLPEIVSSPFVLEPAEGADPIQAPLPADLASVHAREGQEVKAGDELFALRSDEIRDWQSRLRQFQEDQRALEERTRKLDQAHTAELAIKDAEVAAAERELAFRQRYHETSQEFLRRAQVLAAEKLISQMELMRNELDTAAAEKDVVLSEKAKQQCTLQRQQLVTARDRQRIDESLEAEKLKVQIAALQKQLENCRGEFKLVRAPYDAVVLSMKQRNVGSVVNTGAELCQLARLGAHPVVRLTLPESALARIKPGQELRLRYDAYPYQRYGAATAVLERISPAAIAGPEGSFFLAAASLPPGPAGRVIEPRLGMRGVARILIGRRTLAQKVLEPFRALPERLLKG